MALSVVLFSPCRVCGPQASISVVHVKFAVLGNIHHYHHVCNGNPSVAIQHLRFEGSFVTRGAGVTQVIW